jgi:hypothetical protein
MDLNEMPMALCGHGNADPCRNCIMDARAAGYRIATAEHETWKQEATEKAHEYAERFGLCSEFDKFMESIGLEGRTRTYRVEVNVTLTVTVEVEATSEDAALEAVEESDVRSAVLSLGRFDDLDDWEPREANA